MILVILLLHVSPLCVRGHRPESDDLIGTEASAVQVRAGVQMAARTSSHKRTIRQHMKPDYCLDLLVACPAFTYEGNSAQFPPVLVKRTSPSWYSPSSDANIGVISNLSNNVNDMNAVLHLANSSIKVVAKEANWIGTAVPFFNLGLQALEWGAQTYQAVSVGCSQKTFMFCHPPREAGDRIRPWPQFMPQSIGLDTLIYLELVAGRISAPDWRTYMLKSTEVTCLKSVMRKIEWDCVKAAEMGGGVDVKYHCRHSMADFKISDHPLQACKASDYLKPEMCEGITDAHCGICNGRIDSLPPYDIPSLDRELDSCELNALKNELVAIRDGHSTLFAENTAFDAEAGNSCDAPPANQVARVVEKWAAVEQWIHEQNNYHLEALHGCMRMNSITDEDDGKYFEVCFMKMCNVPEGATVHPGEGVNESRFWTTIRSHQVGKFHIRSTPIFKSLLDASCQSYS